MARAKANSAAITRALLGFALRLEGAEESVACAGTAIEKRTVKSCGRAFLFVGPKDLMLKLGPSLGQARTLARADPEHCRAGAGGWVSLRFEDSLPLPSDRVQEWIRESHALLAGRAAQAPPKARSASRRSAARRKRSG